MSNATAIIYTNAEDNLKTSIVVSPTPTYEPSIPTSTQDYQKPSLTSTFNTAVTYIPDSTYTLPKLPTEKQESTYGSKTSSTVQPTRTIPDVYSTTSVTWPLTSMSDKHHPSWTPQPLEIIPADDLEDTNNYLEEAPSNRIPNYEEAPNKIPPSHPSHRQPTPSATSTTAPPKHRPNPSSTTSSAANKPTQDTPIITVNDNQENEIPHFHKNEKGGVKYGHKHEGKSISSAQAKLNMGMLDFFYFITLFIHTKFSSSKF